MNVFFKGKEANEDKFLVTERKSVLKLVSDLHSLSKSITTYLEGCRNFTTSSTVFSQSDLDLNLANLSQTLSTFHSKPKSKQVTLHESQINSVLTSLQNKITLFNELDSKATYFDTLCKLISKATKKISDAQRRSEFASLGKLTEDLSRLHSDKVELENELCAKYEYICESEKRVYEMELMYFKQLQVNMLSGCLQSILSDEGSRFEGLQVDFTGMSLKDEFLKFSMRLEEKVVKRKKEKEEIETLNLQHSQSIVPPSSPTLDPEEKIETHFESEEVPKVEEEQQEEEEREVESFVEQKEVEVEEEVQNEEGERYVALYEYIASQEDEITLSKEDVVVVQTKAEDGWFLGTNLSTQQTGYFPGNFIQPQTA